MNIVGYASNTARIYDPKTWRNYNTYLYSSQYNYWINNSTAFVMDWKTRGGESNSFNSLSNPNHKKFNYKPPKNNNHDLGTVPAFNHVTLGRFREPLTQSEGWCAAVWIYVTSQNHTDWIDQNEVGKMWISSDQKFMNTYDVEVDYFYLFCSRLAPGASTIEYYYGKYDANMNPCWSKLKTAENVGNTPSTYDKTSISTNASSMYQNQTRLMEYMAIRGDWNKESINNYLYYRKFTYGPPPVPPNDYPIGWSNATKTIKY